VDLWALPRKYRHYLTNYFRAKKEKKGFQIGKLIENDKNNWFYRLINHAYKFSYIVWSFSKKLLWFGSCSKYLSDLTTNIVAFMYMMPMAFEIFNE
jgi:hypothetical protein